MKMNKLELQKHFEEISDGVAPEEFLKEKVPQLLELWINGDPLDFEKYKYIGPYWENLKGVLQKYSPGKFRILSKWSEQFDNENIEVKKEYDLGSDELNFIAALVYMDVKSKSMMLPTDPHIIELNGEDYAYEANRSIDQDMFFQRDFE